MTLLSEEMHLTGCWLCMWQLIHCVHVFLRQVQGWTNINSHRRLMHLLCVCVCNELYSHWMTASCFSLDRTLSFAWMEFHLTEVITMAAAYFHFHLLNFISFQSVFFRCLFSVAPIIWMCQWNVWIKCELRGDLLWGCAMLTDGRMEYV